jgi:hypothetical protein
LFDFNEQEFLSGLLGLLEGLEAMNSVSGMSVDTFGADIIPETVLTEESADVVRVSAAKGNFLVLVLAGEIGVVGVGIVILLLQLHIVINSLVFNTKRGREV